ncbi:MAG: ArsR/SmtB family transcription factor [Candidatus Baltobacteraceae bacterium]
MPKVSAEQSLAFSTELSAKYFRALGDPTRLRIIDLLIAGPLTVSEIVEILRCPQSRVSNHLACLRWCGFVSSTAQGRWVTYSVTDPRLKKVTALVRELVSRNAEHVAACTRIGD